MRGPATATFGTVCSQSCWTAPPITSRSPWPRRNDRERPPPRGRSRNGRGAPTLTMATRGSTWVWRMRSPCQATLSRPGPVVVAADRVELPAVVARQRPADLLQQGERARALLRRPPPDQPRLVDEPVVHRAPCAAATAAGPPARRRRGPSPPAIGAGGPASSSRPAPAGARPATTGRTRARRRRTGWPATRPCPAGPSHPAARSPNVRPPGDRRREPSCTNTCSPYMRSHTTDGSGAPARGFWRAVPTLRRCRLRR